MFVVLRLRRSPNTIARIDFAYGAQCRCKSMTMFSCSLELAPSLDIYSHLFFFILFFCRKKAAASTTSNPPKMPRAAAPYSTFDHEHL